MNDNSRSLSKKATRSKADSLLSVLLKGVLRLFVKPEDNLTQLQKWEREKAIKLGLAVNSSGQNRHQKNHVDFVPWNREKASHFDLAQAPGHKKSVRKSPVKKNNIEPESRSEIFSASDSLLPKLEPPPAFAAAADVDEFFKVIGYD